ncbi:MAG TPA: GldG family protein [Verrucomicrobiae bacterium]|jgi:hypothetical protein|nr:GldG family protein [Verrucomicrobiae bacterium]
MAEPDQPQSSFSAARRWLIGLNVTLKIAAFLAIVVMLNFLAAGHFKRWQWAGDSMLKLSAPTRAVLASLTNDVTVTIFFQPHGENEEIYKLTASLLEEYRSACPNHVRVRTLDYSREDSEARELLNRLRLDAAKEKDFVLVEGRGQTKVMYARDLADYDFSGLVSGRSKYVRRIAFRGELLFTSAIYAVSYGEPAKSYFLTGHGERDPGKPGEDPQTDGGGVSRLAALLKNGLNCDWAKWSLLGTNTLPEDCQLLVIAGPSVAEISPEEMEKINGYLNQGGRLLVLAQNPLETRPDFDPGLNRLLKPWGLALGESYVVDTDKRYQIGRFDFLTGLMNAHPIMNSLMEEDSAIRMSAPRPIFAPPASTVPGAPQVKILAQTSEAGRYGAKDGSFGLLAAVEQGVIPGVSAQRSGTRMVVAGDVDFLDDRNLNTSANYTFADRAMNWLLDRPQLAVAGVPPHPIREYRVYLTRAQSRAVHWLFLGAMPGAVLALGGLVWLRRRN